ncbi:indole-3-acetic acid-induced protein ARG7 [Brassica rapa]|uniref:indole-3-acetic acid-induced protein ARG7 n=1 Tax=Brassica campestris TaxID=3711 RepID=UPI0004F18504|nr:indole-3-acetic acid-induced protein ARG7 [Brassica rapa]
MKMLYSKGMRLSELMEKWRKRKKGYFTVYTKEGKRFVLPLDYLNHPILQVLLEMAEDEFGTTIDGPLKIPCDGSLMDHVIMLVRRSMSDNYDDDGEKKSEDCSTSTCKGASISSLIPLFRGQSQIRSLVS